MAFTQKGNLKTHIRRAHADEGDLDSAAVPSRSLAAPVDRPFIMKLMGSDLQLSESGPELKIPDGISMHNGENDDLDLTADSNLVSFL